MTAASLPDFAALAAPRAALEPPFAVVDLDAFDANAAALLRAGGGQAACGSPPSPCAAGRSWRAPSAPASAACSPSRCPRRCGSTSTGSRTSSSATRPRTPPRWPRPRGGRVTLMADCEAHLDAAPAGGRVCLDVDAGWRPLRRPGPDRRAPLAGAHARGGRRARAGRAGPRPRGRRADGLRGADRRRRATAPPGRPLYGAAVRAMQAALGPGAGRAAGRDRRGGAGRGAAALRQRRRHGLRGPHRRRPGRDRGRGRLGPVRARRCSTPTAPGARARRPSSSCPSCASRARRARRCWAAATSPPGAPGRDRLPRPVHPPGLRLDRAEGAGEVQTPLLGPGAAGLRGRRPRVVPARQGGRAVRALRHAGARRRRARRGRGADLPGRGPTFL